MLLKDSWLAGIDSSIHTTEVTTRTHATPETRVQHCGKHWEDVTKKPPRFVSELYMHRFWEPLSTCHSLMGV